MVQSKINKMAINLSKKLKVINDETRLKLCIMITDKDCYVKYLIEKLKIEPTLLSHHLALLRNAGYIQAVRYGKEVSYSATKTMPLISTNTIDF